MIFGKKSNPEPTPVSNERSAETLVLFSSAVNDDRPIVDAVRTVVGEEALFLDSISAEQAAKARSILCLYQPLANLQALRSALRGTGNRPRIVLLLRGDQLSEVGVALAEAAEQEELFGYRLLVADTAGDIAQHLPSRLTGECETNIIKMPVSPEVENTAYKYFYCISPQLQSLVRAIRELAENNIQRVYLLGGPGAGKTSLAYYYWLCRKKGRFVALNLVAENTGDKTGIKSLLCGHVTGAIPGAASREGALSYAEDGVCFLDESHGMSGAVMEVLMEVLDNSQYLPMGATKKRALDCAVIFASNRSWQTLMDSLPLDEHARLGATVISISDLCTREEDIIAIVATTLGRLQKQFTSWKSPAGLSAAAWQQITACRWQGNVRTLIRVLEAGAIRFARRNATSAVLEEEDIAEGLKLWEPERHESQKIYASYR